MKTESREEVAAMTAGTVMQLLTQPAMQELVKIATQTTVDDMARQSALSGSILVWEMRQAQVLEIATDVFRSICEAVAEHDGDVVAAVKSLQHLALLTGGSH